LLGVGELIAEAPESNCECGEFVGLEYGDDVAIEVIQVEREYFVQAA